MDGRQTRHACAGRGSAYKGSARKGNAALAGALIACLAAGCATAASPGWWPWKKTSDEVPGAGAVQGVSAPSEPASPSAPKDSFIMRGLGLEREFTGDDRALAQELEGAKQLYQNKEYAKAETTFHRIANLRKGPVNIMEEALFYEGDCQRLRGDYRTASGTYMKYLKEMRSTGQFTDQVLRRLFDIANYWLDDTRKLMVAYEEQREGKRWMVMPVSYFHVSKDKPIYDAEGHALRILEEIRLNDIRGPLGEKALFYIATVKFFREDYRDADYYYNQLYEHYPNSELAPKAIKQAIICKQIMHGGTDYDTRSVEESRKLIDGYQNAYPEWHKDREWLTRQLAGIHLQQADRDFKVGEFYRRTGHPGSAFFYYELVRRRYPGTEYAQKAEERMSELRGVADKERTRIVQNAFQPPQPPAPAPAAPTAESANAFSPPAPTPVPNTAPNAFSPPATTAPLTVPNAFPTPAAPVSEPPAPLPIAPSVPQPMPPPVPRLLAPNFAPM
jgi:TolA-binding protein